MRSLSRRRSLLSQRNSAATSWWSAASRGSVPSAIKSEGMRTSSRSISDMSEIDLEEVRIPSLFIADGTDPLDAALHQEVAALLRCESKLLLLDRLLIPPSAAVDWYVDHFQAFYQERLSGVLPGPWDGVSTQAMTHL